MVVQAVPNVFGFGGRVFGGSKSPKDSERKKGLFRLVKRPFHQTCVTVFFRPFRNALKFFRKQLLHKEIVAVTQT